MVGRANDRRYQEVSAVLLNYCKGKTIDWNVQDENGDTPVLFALKSTFGAKCQKDMGKYHLYLRALKNILEIANTPMNLDGYTALQIEYQHYLGYERDEEVDKLVQNHLDKFRL